MQWVSTDETILLLTKTIKSSIVSGHRRAKDTHNIEKSLKLFKSSIVQNDSVQCYVSSTKTNLSEREIYSYSFNYTKLIKEFNRRRKKQFCTV